MTEHTASRTPPFIDDDARWAAVQRRDGRADGVFYYSVRTTGIYSRPSCASRPARRENVVFFTSARAAERAGYRPCLRCRPHLPPAQRGDGTYVTAVARACALIGAAVEPPSLAELAEVAGFSRFHFHRVFKSVTGLTPQAYVAARRAQRLRHVISRTPTVTEAIYEAGFASHGNFYGLTRSMLGMTPTRFRTGGSGVRMTFSVSDSSLGPVLVAMSEGGVCSVLTGDDEDRLVRRLRRSFPQARIDAGDRGFDERLARAVRRSELPGASRDLPLEVRTTALTERLRMVLPQVPAPRTPSAAPHGGARPQRGTPRCSFSAPNDRSPSACG